ncbi:MAG TPA: DUF1844 domain-containing protein [Methylomirabilota bacterium]|jgi:hypothetical protein|nr:DUF1844 domain-containing protein [Methylomirabilota bacterium]
MSEDEPFKVTDRRGRARDVERAEPEPGRTTEPSPAPGGSARPESAEPSARPAAGSSTGPDLQGLFVMFASSALINLGEAADPVTGQKQVDLDQAQEAIDALILLRDKTNGNRTEEESRLLEEILYDLQLRFVRAAQGTLRG